jgi:hypothetical protein
MCVLRQGCATLVAVSILLAMVEGMAAGPRGTSEHTADVGNVQRFRRLSPWGDETGPRHVSEGDDGSDPNDIAATVAGPADANEVTAVPEKIRAVLDLSPFYRKYLDVGGLPVVGSADVSDFALREAAWIIRRMLDGHEEILQALAANRVRVAVMAWNEFTTDVPEHSHLEPKAYWDRRARGLGATRRAPAVSCAEENLLCFPGDPYPTENILIHEFAHTIHLMALSRVDPTFDRRLRAAYERAKEQGLWPGTYAITDRQEYWAEGVQCWFDNNRENDSCHGPVNTRVELRQYDPQLANLCEQVFGAGSWRYRKPMDRDEAGRAHLAGWDPATSPRFRWRAPERSRRAPGE